MDEPAFNEVRVMIAGNHVSGARYDFISAIRRFEIIDTMLVVYVTAIAAGL